MSDEVIINDKTYLAIRRAAGLVLYSPDYITRLAREQKVRAVQLGRKWFVNPESLQAYVEVQQHEQGIRKKHLREERQRERLQQPAMAASPRKVFESHMIAVAFGVLLLGVIVGTQLTTVVSSDRQLAAVADPRPVVPSDEQVDMIEAIFAVGQSDILVDSGRSVERPRDEQQWTHIHHE